MELWIRTQDRMRLVKANRLHIKQESKNFGGDWYIYESQNSLRYGTYNSKERTLEVLDDIQTMLSPKLHSVINKDGINIEVLDKNYDVYEMPLE